MTALLLLGGAALLVAGAELLVRGAARIARAVGVPSLVIGLTVVAFGTSAPELAVSVGATLTGDDAIAVGNVVGSNIFNVLFILGISALVVPLTVQQQLVRLDLPVMLVASLVLFAVAADGAIGRIEGILFCAALFGYTAALIRKGRTQVDADVQGQGATPPMQMGRFGIGGALATAALGLVLLVLGARTFVRGAVDLAASLGVSNVVVGLTVIAAGTSLPEVATSILASIRGERDIAVGNVVGSNIFNILGILGVCGIVAPGGVEVPTSMIAFDIPVMIAVALATLPIFFSGMRISRGEGLLFLAYYAVWTAYLIMDATAHDALSGFSRVMLLGVLPATAVVLAIITWRSLRQRR